MKQSSPSMTGYFDEDEKTRREEFLTEMEQVVPWARLLGLIEPHYPKGSPARARPEAASPLPQPRACGARRSRSVTGS